MKEKFPPVFKISEYQNLFDNESEITHPNGLKKNKETKEMNLKRMKIIEILSSENCRLQELEILTIHYKQLYIINNLDFYLKVYNQVDVKSDKENKYRAGSVRWITLDGKDTSVRVSLGRVKSENAENKNKFSKDDLEKVKDFLIKNKLSKF